MPASVGHDVLMPPPAIDATTAARGRADDAVPAADPPGGFVFSDEIRRSRPCTGRMPCRADSAIADGGPI
jgi:hypothetical protein